MTEIFSITKVLALLLIIIAGLVHLGLGNTENLSPDSVMQVRQCSGDLVNIKNKVNNYFYFLTHHKHKYYL